MEIKEEDKIEVNVANAVWKLKKKMKLKSMTEVANAVLILKKKMRFKTMRMLCRN